MNPSIFNLKNLLTKSIYGLSDKKSIPISEYILFTSLSIMRGRNKNPIIHTAGSISTKYFQEKFKISRSLCCDILDFCFDRIDEYRTGACKPSIPKGWLKELTLKYISEIDLDNNKILSTDNFEQLPENEDFIISFKLPIENIKNAILHAKLMYNEDEYHTFGPNNGEIKNNKDEYKMAQIYLEAALLRDGVFYEKYDYKTCGRLYQTRYGFQNMKKCVRNIAFKGFYNIDINSSFFRMAYDLYASEWDEELKNVISGLLEDKNLFYNNYVNPKELKINLLAILLGCNDQLIINYSELTYKINNLLNKWMSPVKRRKIIANPLFHKEQEYIRNIINEINELPCVLIHDGFIVNNNYKLDEKIWSIKKL